jgi:hypothetical protein
MFCDRDYSRNLVLTTRNFVEISSGSVQLFCEISRYEISSPTLYCSCSDTKWLKFSPKDQGKTYSCSSVFGGGGGWWYNNCLQSLLTGNNLPGTTSTNTFYKLSPGAFGIVWHFNAIPGIDEVGATNY